MEEDEDEEIQRKVGRLGPKPRPFSELGRLQQRRVTQEAFDNLKKVAEARQIEPVNVAGYMMKRYRKFSNSWFSEGKQFLLDLIVSVLSFQFFLLYIN